MKKFLEIENNYDFAIKDSNADITGFYTSYKFLIKIKLELYDSDNAQSLTIIINELCNGVIKSYKNYYEKLISEFKYCFDYQEIAASIFSFLTENLYTEECKRHATVSFSIFNPDDSYSSTIVLES